MNVAPLVWGLLTAFGLIGLIAGTLATRWPPAGRRGWRINLVIGLAGAYAGGLLFGLAPLDMEDGLIGGPLAAAVGAGAALFVMAACRGSEAPG